MAFPIRFTAIEAVVTAALLLVIGGAATFAADKVPAVTPLHKHGTLGVHFKRTVSPGALITGVAPNSPADRAGLRIGDRIVRINESLISRYEDVIALVGQLSPGDQVELLINRYGELESLSARLGGEEVFSTVSAKSSSMPRLVRPSSVPQYLRGLQPADVNDQHGYGS